MRVLIRALCRLFHVCLCVCVSLCVVCIQSIWCFVNTHTYKSNGYRVAKTPIRCLKLQVIFHKRATNYRALCRKMTCSDTTSYGASPPCTMYMNVIKWNYVVKCLKLQVIFRKRATNYRALCAKWATEIRHPMGLRHSVWCIWMLWNGIMSWNASICIMQWLLLFIVFPTWIVQGGKDPEDALYF